MMHNPGEVTSMYRFERNMKKELMKYVIYFIHEDLKGVKWI